MIIDYKGYQLYDAPSLELLTFELMSFVNGKIQTIYKMGWDKIDLSNIQECANFIYYCIGHTTEIREGNYGAQYWKDFKKIVINPDSCVYDDLETIVFHEMSHYVQYETGSDVLFDRTNENQNLLFEQQCESLAYYWWWNLRKNDAHKRKIFNSYFTAYSIDWYINKYIGDNNDNT